VRGANVNRLRYLYTMLGAIWGLGLRIANIKAS
jgi:hypothetical protein